MPVTNAQTDSRLDELARLTISKLVDDEGDHEEAIEGLRRTFRMSDAEVSAGRRQVDDWYAQPDYEASEVFPAGTTLAVAQADYRWRRRVSEGV